MCAYVKTTTTTTQHPRTVYAYPIPARLTTTRTSQLISASNALKVVAAMLVGVTAALRIYEGLGSTIQANGHAPAFHHMKILMLDALFTPAATSLQ